MNNNPQPLIEIIDALPQAESTDYHVYANCAPFHTRNKAAAVRYLLDNSGSEVGIMLNGKGLVLYLGFRGVLYCPCSERRDEV